MRKFLTLLSAIILLTACNSRSKAIDTLLEELNSPSFRAMQTKTGLFDDTKAEVVDNTFTISFLCRPTINLAMIDHDQYAQLEASCVEEFKSHLVDPTFKSGLEAIRDANMTILMIWQDINGAKITIPVDPARILSDPSAK